MAASAVEPRGVVAVYFWGCRPQPPPRPPWVTLLAPSFRRPRSPPRVSSTPPPPPPAPRCPAGGGLVFPSGGEKSLCLSLWRPGALFPSLSRHRRAHNLSQDCRRVPDDTPADDDSWTTQTSRCLPGFVVVAPNDGGLAGCSGGAELPEMNLGGAARRAAWLRCEIDTPVERWFQLYTCRELDPHKRLTQFAVFMQQIILPHRLLTAITLVKNMFRDSQHTLFKSRITNSSLRRFYLVFPQYYNYTLNTIHVLFLAQQFAL